MAVALAPQGSKPKREAKQEMKQNNSGVHLLSVWCCWNFGFLIGSPRCQRTSWDHLPQSYKGIRHLCQDNLVTRVEFIHLHI